MRQFRAEFHKTKIIDAIFIDVDNKSISKIKVQNNENYLQKILDFYKYVVMDVPGSDDCLFVSCDYDSRTKKPFLMKGKPKYRFNGNAVILRLPKSNNYQKLMKTHMSVEEVEKLITFL